MTNLATEASFRDDFNPEWEETQTTWVIATWEQNGAKMDPSRCKTDGEGLLVQTVLAGAPPRGGSLQTTREFGYGRWEARIKPSSVPGVLNSMFTMDWDDLTTEVKHDGDKDEIDIEFLTYTFGPSTGKVHLAIHTKGKSGVFGKDLPLDFNPSDDFHVWGFDVLPGRVQWHVDGKIICQHIFKGHSFITAGYEVFFNSWTKKDWIKGPAKEQAEYLIDWVKFTPLKEAGK